MYLSGNSTLSCLVLNSLYLASNDKNAFFFTSEQPNRYKLWSCQKMCDALHYGNSTLSCLVLNSLYLASNDKNALFYF